MGDLAVPPGTEDEFFKAELARLRAEVGEGVLAAAVAAGVDLDLVIKAFDRQAFARELEELKARTELWSMPALPGWTDPNDERNENE